MSDIVRINLQMPSKLQSDLQDISTRDSRSVADVIREACREYVYRDKRKGISRMYKKAKKECVNG